VAKLMAEPHPPTKQERLCWLGGVPEWNHGLLTLPCRSGDVYSANAPRALADSVTRCHPMRWENATPPKLRDFEQADWFESLRAHGMVVV